MSENIERPSVVTDEHLEYLNDLRESGIVNNVWCCTILEDVFEVSKSDARTILFYWMDQF